MAEQGKVISPEGDEYRTPHWALDSTVTLMVDELKKLLAAKNVSNTAQEKLIKRLEAALGNQNKQAQKIADDKKKADKTRADDKERADKSSADDLEDINQDMLNALSDIADQVGSGGAIDPTALENFNRELADAEAISGKVYDGLAFLGKGFVGLASAIGLGMYKAVTGAGETLNELTRTGVGFGDAQGTSIQALGQLSMAGVDASRMLTEFSRVGAVLGVSTFAKLLPQFTDLTKAGLGLGLTLEENAERYAAELETRAKLGILNQVSAMQVQRETMRTMKTQQLYAQALGQTVDELRTFADTLVTDTDIVSGSLLRFNGTVQSQVVAGLKDFGTTMMGLGGAGGSAIAQAMTQAAAGGALGFSQNLAQYTAVLPRLQQTTNKLTNAFQQGTLTQEQSQEIARDFASELGNLSMREKQRIFAMERAGVEGATEMANAVRNFQASAKRMEDLKVDPDSVQKGTNALANILSRISGLFEKLRYDFLDGFGSAMDGANSLGDVFEDIQTGIFKAITDTFGKFDKTLKGADGSIKSLGDKVGSALPDILTKLGGWLETAIRALPAIIKGVVAFSKGIVNVVGFLSSFSGILLGLTVAFVAFVAITKLATLAQAAYQARLSVSGMNFKEGFKKLLGGKTAGGSAGGAAAKNITDGAKGAGAGGKGLMGFGRGFKSMMVAIAQGLKLLGKAAMNPMVWAGLGLLTVAILAIATALRIAAPGIEAFGKLILNVFKGIGEVLKAAGTIIFNIMKGMGAIIKSVLEGIGAIFESIGKVILSVMKGIGAIIMAVGNSIKSVMQGIGAIIMSIGKAIATVFLSIGSAAQMMGSGIKMIFDGIAGSITSFKDFILAIGTLSGTQLLGAAAGITAVGAALAVLGAGGLVSGIARGLGNLFADDPIGQFIELGKVAPGISNMAEEMRNFGGTVDAFVDALEDLDGNFVETQMNIIAEAFKTLEAALNEISWMSLAKLAAFKFIDKITGAKSKAEALTTDDAVTTDDVTAQAGGPQAVITAKAAQKELPDNFKATYSQFKLARNDPETYEKFQELRKTKEEEYMAQGGTRLGAETRAERDALKVYAPQIEKAGAGTFTTPDGTPITFGADKQTVAPQQAQIRTEREKAFDDLARGFQPASTKPVTPTSTQVVTGETSQEFAGGSELGADTLPEPLTQVAGGETERPIKDDATNSELLLALQENNRLLTTHIRVSRNIADQI